MNVVNSSQRLTPGKMRGLQTCATSEGIFAILPVDHRDSLRAMIVPEAPEKVTAQQLTDIKLSVVKHLASASSAVLLDPLYSAGQAIVGGELPGAVGLLCALEEQGYLGDTYNRHTQILAGWSVNKAKRLGAGGVKLLLYYHPDAGTSTQAQERLVRSVAADCLRYDIPLFLEPISFSPDPDVPKGSSQFAALRPQVVLESVRRLSAIGPDVMKVEFPVDANYDADQTVWAEACAQLDEVSRIPWTLLSAGVPFETFKQQLRVACQAGCSGFIGGRAIWKEVVDLKVEERANFLRDVARQRLLELRAIALEHGTPWSKRVSGTRIDEHWFQQY
jgi:tagatose 1,6-diphosphate aldolase